MTYKPLNIEKILNLERFEKEPDALTAIIAYLEAITVPAHSDDGGHKFEDDPDNNGVCKHCGWVHPDVPHVCGNHSLVRHLQGLLQQLKDISEGKDMPDLEITIVMTSKHAPRRRKRWLF